ncbi:MAG: hypothetical protein EWV90_05090 [Microcystis aeruginosa Ma_QC_Ch_20071001_M135]|nr:MAG: hypothetical protein EWV90_05090 [Microcystis aeruginosa Ma_QC_Ch_20071001_M135]
MPHLLRFLSHNIHKLLHAYIQLSVISYQLSVISYQLSVISQHLPVVCSSVFLKVGFPFLLFTLKMSLSSDQFIYFLIPTHN